MENFMKMGKKTIKILAVTAGMTLIILGYQNCGLRLGGGAKTSSTSTSGALSSGTFSNPMTYSSSIQPYKIVSGDFNGDGKPDLAVVDYASNSVGILLNKGDGTFLPQPTFIV